MLRFSLVQKVKILFGRGSAAQTGELVKEAGFTRAFVVYDQGVKAAGIVDRVLKSLDEAGVQYVTYDKVQSEPPDYIIDEASALCNEAKCDTVIAIGGGSSIDTGKGVNMLRFNPGKILDYATPTAQIKPSPGLICIPTTAGTGSELSDGIVLTNSKNNLKAPILAINAMSEYAIVDPETMVGMPPHLTALTGLDALTHVCESCTSIFSNALINQLCEKMISIIYQWLPAAIEDGKNIEAREYMAIASSVGGWMLTQGSANFGHGIGHTIGAMFHIPHGAACSYVLPYALEFTAPCVPEQTMKIGRLLGGTFAGNESPEEIGAITRDALIKFRDEVVKLKPISEYNCDKSRLQECAELALKDPLTGVCIRKAEVKDALNILNKIFS